MLDEENKFEIGKCYRCSSLYGGPITYIVTDRDDSTVTMKEEWIAEDTGDLADAITKYEIEIDQGIEKVLIWEYHGHEAYIYANEYICR